MDAWPIDTDKFISTLELHHENCCLNDILFQVPTLFHSNEGLFFHLALNGFHPPHALPSPCHPTSLHSLSIEVSKQECPVSDFRMLGWSRLPDFFWLSLF